MRFAIFKSSQTTHLSKNMFGSPAAFLLASLSLFSLVAAGGDYAKCETSGGSPWTYDCTNALNALNKSKCYQVRIRTIKNTLF
jgi:hypothetical protein